MQFLSESRPQFLTDFSSPHRNDEKGMSLEGGRIASKGYDSLQRIAILPLF